MRSYQAVVLGAGIVGLTAAYFLGEAGIKTALIDLEIPGKGGSCYSAGIITRQLYTKREIKLASRSINILLNIIPNINELIYGREFITIEQEDIAFQDYRFYRKYMGDVKIYYSDELGDKWSHIKIDDDEAIVYTSRDLMVDTRGILDSLSSLIDSFAEVEKVIGEASEIREEDGLTLELEDGRRMKTEYIIVAMGAWNKEFLGYHRIYLPVHTYVCFSLHIKTPYDIEISGSDETNYFYWQRLDNKNILAGEYYQSTPISTPEEVRMISTCGKMESLRRTLKERFRKLNKIKFREILVGPCSYTQTKRPLQKKVMKNTYVIDGLGGYGYTLGPALAEEVTEKIIQNY
jgi:glycine/D-amino acid oxidase-like deaminating enzyme